MVGELIGKYRVVEQVGRGGMGTVFRAVDETLHRDVALKMLNADLNDPALGRRFRAEAVAIARLNHPGIATIYELFEHDGRWLMAMEFVRGETLEGLVTRSGPITAERTAELAQQALAALAHAHHMGVIHRDLKPANLMLNDAGRLKITDFGIARVAGTEHLTSAGFMMGTPAYMAPEQVLGNEIDARADLYAIACVMYFLTTTKLPFKGVTPLELAESRIRDMPTPIRTVRELPMWFGEVLDRALNRDPGARFQSADVFREALRRGLAGQPIDPPAPAATSTPAAGVKDDTLETMMPGRLAIDPALANSAQNLVPERPATAAVPAPPPVPEPAADSSTAETRLLSATGSPLPRPTGAIPQPTVRTPPVPQAISDTRRTELPSPETVKSPLSPTPPVGPAASLPPTVAKKKNPTALIAAAAAVVIVIVAGAIWMRSRSTPDPAPPPPAQATEVPAPPPPAATIAPQPVEVTPPVAPPPTTTVTPPATPPTGDPQSTPPPAGTIPPGAPGAVPPGGRATGRRGAPPPEIAITFENVRLLRVNGRNGQDFDAEVRFGNGAIVVVPKRAGTDQLSVPYRELLRATYAREANPRWAPDTGLATPPQGLDVPGIGLRSRHWLVLQGAAWYIILSLSDNNWEQLLHIVTERTRVTIDKPGLSKNH